MSCGWFKIHRRLFDSPVWTESSPEQKVVFLTVLGLARFRGEHITYKGKDYRLEPGQFISSVEDIATRAGQGIKRQTARLALARLAKREVITQQACGRLGSLITVLNWEKYQGGEDTEENGDKKTNEKTKDLTRIKGHAKPDLSTRQTELAELLTQGKTHEKTNEHAESSTPQSSTTPKKDRKEREEENSNNMSNIESVSTGADVVQEIWAFYITTLAKWGVKLNRRLNESRRDTILKAMRRGHTAGELKKAIENTWFPGSHWLHGKYFDLIYAIAQRKGIDNVDARQEQQGVNWDEPGPLRRGRKVGSRINPDPKRKNRYENK